MTRARIATLAAVMAALSAAPAAAKDPKIGDPAPVFSGVDDTGKPWKSTDHVGKNVLVVFFYPAAMTGG